MIYTENIRKELDSILKAFDTYIEGQNYFDIVYSKKIGYVWILADHPGDAGAVQLDTPEIMLDMLFNEIINDVINAPENKSHISDVRTLTEWEETESRRRIAAILETIETEGEIFLDYLDYLDSYLKDHQGIRD